MDAATWSVSIPPEFKCLVIGESDEDNGDDIVRMKIVMMMMMMIMYTTSTQPFIIDTLSIPSL